MCKYVGNHPEYRPYQNKEGNGIGGIVADIGKHQNQDTDKPYAHIGNAVLIGFCKALWHHIHLGHALTDTGQTIDGGIL